MPCLALNCAHSLELTCSRLTYNCAALGIERSAKPEEVEAAYQHLRNQYVACQPACCAVLCSLTVGNTLGLDHVVCARQWLHSEPGSQELTTTHFSCRLATKIDELHVRDKFVEVSTTTPWCHCVCVMCVSSTVPLSRVCACLALPCLYPPSPPPPPHQACLTDTSSGSHCAGAACLPRPLSRR